MNRHHPYGGGYDGPPRRGGPAGGFGPDRNHRFADRGGPSRGRGGFRGGRGGGGGSYGAYESYDQGPPQGDMGAYNSYESGPPPQEPYYGNGGFDAGMQDQYASAPDSGDYEESYGNYEDGSGSNYGGFGRQKRGGPRRERDDKVHDSIIEERIQRERPCRTLFIRNIKYETNSEDVRRLFEEHGEIKTFFDLIANRGMVFVTYYDIRAAERARERLQGSEISGRPIDVHYSLPRDDHGSRGVEKDRNQQLQGTLLVTLRNSASGQPIDDNEVRRKFQQFGDVRSVRTVGDRIDQRYVEFFDTRACEEAHDRLRHQGLQDGVMEIVFASELDNPRAQSPRRGDRGGFDRGGRDWDDHPQRGRRGGRGGRGRGRGWGGEDWDRRGDWGRERDRSKTYGEDEFGRSLGRGAGPAFNERFDGRGFGGPAAPGGPGGPGMVGPPPYGVPPPPPPTYGQPPPPPSANIPQTPDERFEQAKKVQQLLAALKPAGHGSTLTPAPQSAPIAQAPMPQSQPPSAYYSAPPMPQYPGAPPAPSPYPPPPPSMQSSPQAAQPPAGSTNMASLGSLPPTILALLQQSGQTQSQQPTPPPLMPQNAYSMPPQVQAPPPPVPGVSSMPPPGQYQALMSYLQQQKRT